MALGFKGLEFVVSGDVHYSHDARSQQNEIHENLCITRVTTV